MFQTVPLSIIRSFSLYTQQWYMSYRFADSLWAVSGRNGSIVLILLASCMTYTTAVCTVKNPWCWTEELSETCRVSFQKNKFEKLVHLVGFIIRKFHNAESSERQIPLHSIINEHWLFYCVEEYKKRIRKEKKAYYLIDNWCENLKTRTKLEPGKCKDGTEPVPATICQCQSLLLPKCSVSCTWDSLLLTERF